MENFDKNEQVINKSESFEINSETGKLVSHGHEYEDTPRMRSFIKQGDSIRNSLPSIPEGFSRLWRANRPGEVGENPSYTNSLEGIALPFSESYGGRISYVDVPNEDLGKYLREGVVAEGVEFFLPKEILQQIKIVEGIGLEEEMQETSFKEQKSSSFGDPV